MTLRDKLFGFKGRVRRLDWWLWGTALGITYMLASRAIAVVLFPDDPNAAESLLGDPLAPLLVSMALTALFSWPQLALSAQRAHDRNWPAWPFVSFYIIGLVASYLPFGPDAALGGHATVAPTMVLTILNVGFLAVGFGVVVALGFLDGTSGPNRFGPSPKAAERPVFSEPGGVG